MRRMSPDDIADHAATAARGAMRARAGAERLDAAGADPELVAGLRRLAHSLDRSAAHFARRAEARLAGLDDDLGLDDLDLDEEE